MTHGQTIFSFTLTHLFCVTFYLWQQYWYAFLNRFSLRKKHEYKIKVNNTSDNIKGHIINTLGFVGPYTVSFIFFFFFFLLLINPFKNVKSFLSSRSVQKHTFQWTWIYPAGLSLQTPSIDYKKLKVTCCVNATQLSKAVISNPPTSAWNVHYT